MERNKQQLENEILTRRYFLQLAGTGFAATSPLIADAQQNATPYTQHPTPLYVDLPHVQDKLQYLTPNADFGTVERGDPLPYKLPDAKLREIFILGQKDFDKLSP